MLSVALDLAFKMGCEPIAFAGQDLPYPPGSAYAKNTVYGDDPYENMMGQKLGNMVLHKDIFGREIATQKSLSVTMQWMEWAFTTWKRQNQPPFITAQKVALLQIIAG